jgi:hypothetical protein
MLNVKTNNLETTKIEISFIGFIGSIGFISWLPSDFSTYEKVFVLFNQLNK